MISLLENNKLVLMEGAVVERVKRSDIQLHPTLSNTPLIYDEKGRNLLKEIWNSYIKIAKETDYSFLMCTPTWRANHLRVKESGIKNCVNVDAVTFMKEIRESHANFSHKIKIGGIVGCKNDCYKPEEGLSERDSEEFHAWQIDQLVTGEVDFLIAETLPNINEALGIANAFEKTGIPYIISFVISRNGCILDGTSLLDAIHLIDNEVTNIPLGYSVNCAYPSFLGAEKQPPEIFNRLIAYLANASSLDHCDLDNSETLQSDSISDWGDEMLKLNRSYGINILGGCCGTSEDHLKYLAENNKN
jgi:S-methylmethionine-dependent homocysteine/selenocysteine methylase